ncbi:MAG: metallophosphoesterase, partial [Spirochaetia bacterium]|nr:metallophosphoesterase [Spirochaetia bacterium]
MWIIGDIHGCLKALNSLLSKIPGDENLLFIGDYVDRGPDSAGVIDRIIIEKHRSVYLLGNHEEMMLDY